MRRMFSLKQLEEISKQVIESGEVSNAKPIWYHGLDIYDGTKRNTIQCHILKNDDNAIDTLAKLKAWAESITGQVFIQASGCVDIGGTWYPVYLLVKNEANQYIICYVDSTSGFLTSTIALEDYFTDCTDRYNKIN